MDTPKQSVSLTNEKYRDYRNTVMLQIIMATSGMVLSGWLLEGPSTAMGKFITLIFSIFGAIYFYLLWDMMRNFTTRKWLIYLILGVLIVLWTSGVLVEFPYFEVIHVPNRQLYLLILHATLFPIEITVISYAVRDIFTGEFLTKDKLWGSACVFLMIALAFASLYDMIIIVNPGALGETIPLGLPNYSACIGYSLSILGGIDPGYPNAIKLIRSIGILESVWSNLFVVLIIGNLMGMPRAPKEN